MMSISFVYFDIGGVLIKDFSCTDKWHKFKLSLGIGEDQIDQFDKLWDKLVEPRVCLDFDVNNLLPTLNTELNANLPNDFSILNEFIIRFEPNNSLWNLVERLQKSGIGIGLLTNMYPRMLAAIQGANLLPSVDWDVIIDSSIETVQKPDPEIFKLSQKKSLVSPEKILFIDNTQKHLDAAKKFGWQTFLFNSCNYSKSSQDLHKLIFP